MAWPCSGRFGSGCDTSCVVEHGPFRPTKTAPELIGTTAGVFFTDRTFFCESDCSNCQDFPCTNFEECNRNAPGCEDGGPDLYGGCCGYLLFNDGWVFSEVSTKYWCDCTSLSPQRENQYRLWIHPDAIPEKLRTSDTVNWTSLCQALGACCDPDNQLHPCLDNIPLYQCRRDDAKWFPNKTCTEIDCSGSCCICGECVTGMNVTECEARGGTPRIGVLCSEEQCPDTRCVSTIMAPAEWLSRDRFSSDEIEPYDGALAPLTTLDVDLGDGECAQRYGVIADVGGKVAAKLCNDRGNDDLCRTIANGPVVPRFGGKVAFEAVYQESLN